MFQINDPIEFNPLKHDRGYIRYYIENASLSLLASDLKRIGGSQMDLYYGPLGISAIREEITALLKRKDVFLPERYGEWIGKGGGYGCVTLSDTSQWVLRMGVQVHRYIHIHPARYSPHTIRVQASVLKTAIACLVCLRLGEITCVDLASVNKIRTGLLDLSPVAALRERGVMEKVMKIIG